MMTFKQLHSEISNRIKSASWTDAEIRKMMTKVEDDLELQIYEQRLIDGAVKIILKMLAQQSSESTTGEKS